MRRNTWWEAVESVLRQSEKRFELWIVEDMSIDNTAEIAEQYTYDGRAQSIKITVIWV